MSTAAPTRTIRATGPVMAWRGIDFIVPAMLAVAFGVAFWAWDTFLYSWAGTIANAYPPLAEIYLGVWLLPAVVGGLLVRRPGAAIFVELIAANVEMLLGNKWGVLVLVSGVLQGLGVELALALFRWRRFDIGVAMLGGILAAVAEIVLFEWWQYVPDYSWPQKIAYLGFGVVSGIVIAGIGGWALTRALGRSGAVDAFPPGQEAREAALR